jgi:hypothetical protein
MPAIHKRLGPWRERIAEYLRHQESGGLHPWKCLLRGRSYLAHDNKAQWDFRVRVVRVLAAFFQTRTKYRTSLVTFWTLTDYRPTGLITTTNDFSRAFPCYTSLPFSGEPCSTDSPFSLDRNPNPTRTSSIAAPCHLTSS